MTPSAQTWTITALTRRGLVVLVCALGVFPADPDIILPTLLSAPLAEDGDDDAGDVREPAVGPARTRSEFAPRRHAAVNPAPTAVDAARFGHPALSTFPPPRLADLLNNGLGSPMHC
jgi:hypothetical protein